MSLIDHSGARNDDGRGAPAATNAAADNLISKAEARRIRDRWEELKTVTEGFVRCCEEGNFAQMAEVADAVNALKK